MSSDQFESAQPRMPIRRRSGTLQEAPAIVRPGNAANATLLSIGPASGILSLETNALYASTLLSSALTLLLVAILTSHLVY
jgi:hypothetical protein